LRHRAVVAFVKRDSVSGFGEKQSLPRAGNARANHRDRGIPTYLTRILMHPCPFAGMTRIRFKGSPRCRENRERAISQLPGGTPLGTSLIYADRRACQRGKTTILGLGRFTANYALAGHIRPERLRAAGSADRIIPE
jgi:hypothetical protein